MRIECYRAIDNKLLFFGVQLMDAAVIIVLFMIVHGIIVSFIADTVFLIGALLTAKRVRNRNDNMARQLYLYFSIPAVLSLPGTQEGLK
ncbi:MAG: hypothetical protein WC955_03930 [Elusimicrobiota bacterium]